MQLDQIILQIGSQAFTLLDVLLAGAALALVLILATLIVTWRAQRNRKSETLEAMRRASELEYRLAEMAGSLRNFADQSQGAQAHLTRTLDERLDHVGQRIGLGLNDQAERTTQSLTHLYERLAVIDAAQKNLTSLSTEMISLKDILSNKQARGAYGQGRMEAIVRDGLHARAYAFQPTLTNGMRPDCLISLPDSELKLVIDAKFPLEAFNALREAKGEGDVRAAEVRLRSVETDSVSVALDNTFQIWESNLPAQGSTTYSVPCDGSKVQSVVYVTAKRAGLPDKTQTQTLQIVFS